MSGDTAVENLLAIAQGDAGAFHQFYADWRSFAMAAAVGILHSIEDAEDVVQEVFARVWEKAGDYSPAAGRPATWLASLTRNRAIDRLRQRQRHTKLHEAASREPVRVLDGIDPVRVAMLGEDCARAQKLLSSLPDYQRDTVTAHYFHGEKLANIARRLKKPVTTIKSRLRNGVRQMQSHSLFPSWTGDS